jgi:DNA-directed RNA polymerase subunit M/transcription elongation factor TFIIS
MASMTVKFQCPQCQTMLEAGSKLVGKTGKCPNCDNEITVPAESEQVPKQETKTTKKQ